MFFKADKEVEDASAGLLYLLYTKLNDGTEVVKIGVTQRPKVQDRVCEILSSFFISYRYFCEVYPKRFKKTSEVYKKETMMHRYYKDSKYEFDKRFDGCNEYFVIEDRDKLLELYQDVLDGKDINVD